MGYKESKVAQIYSHVRGSRLSERKNMGVRGGYQKDDFHEGVQEYIKDLEEVTQVEDTTKVVERYSTWDASDQRTNLAVVCRDKRDVGTANNSMSGIKIGRKQSTGGLLMKGNYRGGILFVITIKFILFNYALIIWCRVMMSRVFFTWVFALSVKGDYILTLSSSPLSWIKTLKFQCFRFIVQ